MPSLDDLQGRIGYKFKNVDLLKRAITHRSFSSLNNERLEFLGDSVLDCVIGYALFLNEKHFNEGSLSRVRSNLVKQSALAEIAEKIGIPDFLKVGEGEIITQGNRRPSTIADALEAIFGAIFIDSGFSQVQTVILRLYDSMLSSLTKQSALDKDPKTNLQELLQSHHLGLPVYDIVSTSGAAHSQVFRVSVTIPKLSVRTEGEGRSRRQAEQEAAQLALENERIKNLKR